MVAFNEKKKLENQITINCNDICKHKTHRVKWHTFAIVKFSDNFAPKKKQTILNYLTYLFIQYRSIPQT